MLNIKISIIEPQNSLIKLYHSCSNAWSLDLGRNNQYNPVLRLDFTPFTRLDPVSHRIIPSFKFIVKLDDPLEIASLDFINSLADSFEISLNSTVLQVQPLINVAKWKFSQDTNRKEIQKFPLQTENVSKLLNSKFRATTLIQAHMEHINDDSSTSIFIIMFSFELLTWKIFHVTSSRNIVLVSFLLLCWM